jgi:hypothetical protein
MYMLSVVTIVNNDDMYRESRESLEIQADNGYFDFISVEADGLGWNAARALNRGIEKGKSDWVVCAHQDVIFPDGWLAGFLGELSKIHENVAVIGLVGNTASGKFVGHVLHPHGHSRWTPLPSGVISVDEHVIVVNRKLNVRFDEENPGFHCYGADICLSAMEKGFDSVVIDAPVVHLSGGKVDEAYQISSDWILKKWGKTMNNTIPTPAAIISTPVLLNVMKRMIVYLNRRICIRYSFYRCDCKRVRHSRSGQSLLKSTERGKILEKT